VIDALSSHLEVKVPVMETEMGRASLDGGAGKWMDGQTSKTQGQSGT